MPLPSCAFQTVAVTHKAGDAQPWAFQCWRGVYPAPTDWEGKRVSSERLNALRTAGSSVGGLSVAWSRCRGRNPAPTPGLCPHMLGLTRAGWAPALCGGGDTAGQLSPLRETQRCWLELLSPSSWIGQERTVGWWLAYTLLHLHLHFSSPCREPVGEGGGAVLVTHTPFLHWNVTPYCRGQECPPPRAEPLDPSLPCDASFSSYFWRLVFSYFIF